MAEEKGTAPESVDAEPKMDPKWERQRAAEQSMYLRQYCLGEAVKLEQANASFQDPAEMTQRVLDNAERFRMYVLPPEKMTNPDTNS